MVEHVVNQEVLHIRFVLFLVLFSFVPLVRLIVLWFLHLFLFFR